MAGPDDTKARPAAGDAAGRARPVFNRYNALLTGDKINTTPTCVIVRSGQRKAFVGRPDIVNALKALQ